ncbi:hypothetical protein QBC41DRAFT_113437 [Cercophora samala]|uniref:C2H2-type domain-containing protein n=1 Tax=Cercophora samala TaxID=330535 RepID=A0AA39ZEK0_9PEZI|nr:hypothetical protein QBC41DRAFT_113437 [Cercophora samala]
MAGPFSTMFGTPSFGYANIDVPFQGLAATQTEDNLYIDPTLAATTQRFLNDNHKVYFTSIGVPALPPPTQQRFASPISSHEPSSASGSAPSPGAETESYYEHPMTPPEIPSVFSPMPGQFDDFSNMHDAIKFTGSGMMPSFGAWTDASMNSLYNDNDMDYNQGMFFESSYSSTQCDLNTGQNTVGSEYNRLASPAEDMPVIKEEIEASATCPPPLKREFDHDSDSASSSEEPSLPPTPQRQSSDEDEDYRPAKRSRVNNQPVSIQLTTTAIPTQVWQPQPSQPKRLPPNPSTRRLNHLSPSSVSFKCPDCSRTDFSDRSDFEAHVKKQHTRPFTCVFHFAGCEATFAAKNEWKRHVITQHLLLDYWLCTEGVCAKTSNPTSHGACPLPNGAIFNRKDLYTQHLKRMHMPAGIKKLSGAGKGNKTLTPTEKDILAQWEQKLRVLQEKGKKERCKLPGAMQCPVKGCKHPEFKGGEAWDQRMEHVAKHLEGAALGREEQVKFGGEEDGSLVEWARSREVGIIERRGKGWELRKVLERQGGQQVRTQGGGRGGRGVKEEIVVKEVVTEEDADGEVDAEGEVE